MYDFIVTGGSGFIGSHFIDILLSKGYRVLNIDKIDLCVMVGHRIRAPSQLQLSQRGYF